MLEVEGIILVISICGFIYYYWYRYSKKKSAMDEKTFEIGDHQIKIELCRSFLIDKILCVVHNIAADKIDFFFFNPSKSFNSGLSQVESDNPQLKINIFALLDDQVLLSSVRTCKYKDLSETPTLTLKAHSLTNSLIPTSLNSFGSPNSTAKPCLQQKPKLNFTVNQQMLYDPSRKKHCPSVEFTLKEEDLKKEYFVEIIQTESTIMTTMRVQSEYKEYIRLVYTIDGVLPCVEIPSREKVTYLIYRATLGKNGQYEGTHCSEQSTFITHNTTEDLEGLKERAEAFAVGFGTMAFKYLYRNKPSDHPTIAVVKETGIMVKYIKDNNGDQASSINGFIDGLFFSASCDKRTSKPKHFSYFGDYRIMIPPQHLLPEHNLYFADFYCNYQVHYVTLVLTKPGTPEDDYCMYRLVKLDVENNDFLFYEPTQNVYKTITRNMPVELLYTENINIRQMVADKKLLEKVISDVRGRGENCPGGIPKNKLCTICNLHKNPGCL